MKNLKTQASHSHSEHDHEHGAGKHENLKYYCPMHCEGDKVYDKPGNCPVCNMHLVPVSE